MSPRNIELEDVRVWREDGLGGQPVEVIHSVGATLGAGRRVAFVGANGAGKTSLLLALVGAVRFAGRIAFDGIALDRSTLAEHRRSIGYVFAEPSDQLFLPTVLEEARLAAEQRRLDDPQGRARRALDAVGLVGLDARAPGSLSLGEQRRLAIATALSGDPGVLLLDEPTASLDARARRRVLEAMRACPATTAFATHDLAAALELEADVLVLAGGRLVGCGPALEVFRDRALLDRAELDAP